MPHATVHGGPTNTPGEEDPRDEHGNLLVPDADGNLYAPDAEVVADEPDDETAPYSAWKVEELRTELAARGLDADGVKADLVARLEANDAEAEVGP